MNRAGRRRGKPGFAVVVLVVALSALALDLARPPAQQVAARALVGAIRLYRGNLSPRLGVACRFRPTCSRYAEAVILRHGAAVGSWLVLRRLARCGPWTPRGTVDPPPTIA